ncbi:MAG: hypothetical protein LBD27_02940 [Tannerella sp.]|jgi:hypothetical protein|nr:hypothetical protein [Tannerella sp.]
MGTKRPLFPQKIEEQVADLNTKQHYIAQNAARFGISTQDVELLQGRVNTVNTAHATASDKNKRTKVDITIRRESIYVAQNDMRKVIDYHITGSPIATEVDYEALRIPRKGYHLPLPMPDSAPGIGRISSSDLTVIVPFFDGKNNRRFKPIGVYAMEAHYQLGGDPPASVVSLSECATDIAPPLRIRFEFDDEFKIVYLAFRWISTRRDYGPWSEIYKVGIAR